MPGLTTIDYLARAFCAARRFAHPASLAAASLIAAGPSGLVGVPAVAAERQVRDIVYDYAVTSYCGTLTPEVASGYRAELAEATERSGLNAEQAKRQRIAGWVAADREWSNRGLGGFRAWCRGEGVDAARQFLSHQRGGS